MDILTRAAESGEIGYRNSSKEIKFNESAQSLAALATERALSYLPLALSMKICDIGARRADFPRGLSEIRIRGNGTSSIVLSGENIPVRVPISKDDLQRTLSALTRNTPSAFAEQILRGYISAEYGIRVGVCGSAGYSDGKLSGIYDIKSLVMRIPSSPSESAYKLYEDFRDGGFGNMLIFSSPGCGKTSALRALAAYIGTGRGARRVVVVDERREFIEENYDDAIVDILSGYEKCYGIEIAVRTLSAEVIIVDEIIDSNQAERISALGKLGVSFIATTHANDIEELFTKKWALKLIKEGFFNTLVALFCEKGNFCYRIYKKNDVINKLGGGFLW